MDVKYIPRDWDKMRDGIGDLIGLGRWGKGMIDELKDLSDNLEDVERDIANYDSDGVISFQHTSQKNRYQGLFEDFKVLHSFTGKVGDIVDRTIDQPFYEDMDAFVEAMQRLSLPNYTTKNRLGVTETQFVYAGYGPAQSFEVPKKEISLDDLFNGDNFYSDQMKLEYEAWQELNPDKDFTQEEYQQAALNTHSFEYETIRNQQENKEFWVQIGALVVIVGVAIICPPAGLVLGAAYGAMELSSAASGKDWISGRELGTEERWVRGLLSPLDIVPGISGLTKFSSTIRLVNIGENMGQLGIKAGVKGSLNSGASKVNQLLKTAEQQSAARLRSAASAIKAGTNVVKNKIARDIVEVARLGDTGSTLLKNTFASRQMGFAMDGIGDAGKVQNSAKNTHAMENWTTDILSNIKGINLGSGSTKDTGKVNHLDDVPRIKEVGVNFKRNDKHDSEEFARQLKDQEQGMNELTVDEYLKNREKYLEQGRAIEGNAAQQAAREEAYVQKINELQREGLTLSKAKKLAKEWLDTQAALHNPDQIAGGKAEVIGGLGDKRINSSIGSQWRYRIDIVDEQIKELAKSMTPEQLKNNYLNVKLTH